MKTGRNSKSIFEKSWDQESQNRHIKKLIKENLINFHFLKFLNKDQIIQVYKKK